jgi:hypothetical protein
MSHFSVESWFDFVRGTTSVEERAEMQNHLDTGCQECIGLSEMWRQVLEVARREQRYQPSPNTVKSVKAAYASEGPWRWLPKRANLARLMYDSFLQPAPVGLRSSGLNSRQFLHEAEPFVIDLRVEREPGQKRISVIGQVLDSRQPEKGIEGVNIVLLSGQELLARTYAKSSGEFSLQFSDGSDLQLFVNIRGQRAIGIVLPDLGSLGTWSER